MEWAWRWEGGPYSNNGMTPRFAGLTPQADYGTGAVARSMFAMNPIFYRQNRNWGASAGQHRTEWEARRRSMSPTPPRGALSPGRGRAPAVRRPREDPV